MGKVFKAAEWYVVTLKRNPVLKKDQSKLNALKAFVDFLETNGLHMSVIGSGSDTKNSSIYNAQSTDQENWLCDIKFFLGGNFADDLIVVGKERMNTADKIYENIEFSKVVEILSGKKMELAPSAKIKEQLEIEGFDSGLKIIQKAIMIYQIFK